MNLTFGCVVIRKNKILLVREKSEKHKQLEKWNLVSGKVDNPEEFIFDVAIKRELKEETGVDVELKGLIGVYESVTPVDRSVYFVVGCEAQNDKIKIGDSDVIDAKWFDLDEFWDMEEEKIVHKDMKLVARNYLDDKYVDVIKSVRYD